jgi:hypothetical protein
MERATEALNEQEFERTEANDAVARASHGIHAANAISALDSALATSNRAVSISDEPTQERFAEATRDNIEVALHELPRAGPLGTSSESADDGLDSRIADLGAAEEMISSGVKMENAEEPGEKKKAETPAEGKKEHSGSGSSVLSEEMGAIRDKVAHAQETTRDTAMQFVRHEVAAESSGRAEEPAEQTPSPTPPTPAPTPIQIVTHPPVPAPTPPPTPPPTVPATPPPTAWHDVHTQYVSDTLNWASSSIGSTFGLWLQKENAAVGGAAGRRGLAFRKLGDGWCMAERGLSKLYSRSVAKREICEAHCGSEAWCQAYHSGANGICALFVSAGATDATPPLGFASSAGIGAAEVTRTDSAKAGFSCYKVASGPQRFSGLVHRPDSDRVRPDHSVSLEAGL